MPSRAEDAERLGIEEGRDRDQHRRQADQASGTPRPAAASPVIAILRAITKPMTPPIDDRDGDLDQAGDLVRDQRRHHRDQHADHAEAVAARGWSPATDRPRSARMKNTPETR